METKKCPKCFEQTAMVEEDGRFFIVCDSCDYSHEVTYDPDIDAEFDAYYEQTGGLI